MSYALGHKLIRKLCETQQPILWQKAKLSAPLFKSYEHAAFHWVEAFLKTHHVLPKVETLVAQFPDLAPLDTPEPVSYYLTQVEHQFFYDIINKGNVESQNILKENQEAHESALEILRHAIRTITEQRYRVRIMDVGKEAGLMVMQAYHQMVTTEALAFFGWPYLDLQSGGLMPGEVVSIVGRPALGKSWKMLWVALKNWTLKKQNILFVSMEMMTLPIAQRVTSLYTGQNIGQLKTSGFSNHTYAKFKLGLKGMTLEQAKFYVVDGNLAASAEDIFLLAEILECKLIFIDGAYLLRHKNARLDRFMRVAENMELIKRFSTDQDATAFCSWQFNRVASQKQKKGKGEEAGLEDIGSSDVIGQISSIVLGLFQEESIETMKERKIRVLKGRNGEVGQFSVNWDFEDMNFDQSDPPVDKSKEHTDLQWI